MSPWHGGLGRRLSALVGLDDPPQRLALSLAVGVFISCTPFWGSQTILSILTAVVFRLNRAATVTGTWLNLPWFAPFVYGAALAVGEFLVPSRSGRRGSEWLAHFLEGPSSLRWQDLMELLQEISVRLLVGTTIVGLVAAAATYVVALALISARRARSPAAGPPAAR